jgi:hypothetical protein
MVRARTAPFVALAAAVVASNALASESYPHTLDRALDMSCPPDCTLCHTTRSGGALTANTPVGISMRRAGLECCDTSQLLDVIAALETDGTDSDADGVSDVDELRAGDDPNATEGKMKCLPPEPDDGCAVRRRAGESRGPWSILVAAVLFAGMRLRRRNRRR